MKIVSKLMFLFISKEVNNGNNTSRVQILIPIYLYIYEMLVLLQIVSTCVLYSRASIVIYGYQKGMAGILLKGQGLVSFATAIFLSL